MDIWWEFPILNLVMLVIALPLPANKTLPFFSKHSVQYLSFLLHAAGDQCLGAGPEDTKERLLACLHRL